MPTLREYFDAESAAYLQRLTELASASNGGFDAAEMHRLTRRLRGTAQIAREDHVYRAALALEAAVRAFVERGLPWDQAARKHIVSALAGLRELAARSGESSERDIRVAAILATCSTLEQLASAGATPSSTAAPSDPAEADALRKQFRDYVAAEVADIARVLEESLRAFERDPMDRAALRAVVRRHRALLGSARLDQIPIVAETLRAVEDIAGVIGKLNVAVKKEWLDVFRRAREVLHSAAEPLRRGEDPRPSNHLSRLRTLHDELLDRYGSVEAAPQPAAAEAAPAASPLAGSTPARPALAIQGAPPPGGCAGPQNHNRAGPALNVAAPSKRGPAPASNSTGTASQQYTGPAALQRALALRPSLEQAVGSDNRAREIIDQLFDLIRLGLT
jgi:chemotaxis protein histidine kinase CheA